MLFPPKLDDNASRLLPLLLGADDDDLEFEDPFGDEQDDEEEFAAAEKIAREAGGLPR